MYKCLPYWYMVNHHIITLSLPFVTCFDIFFSLTRLIVSCLTIAIFFPFKCFVRFFFPSLECFCTQQSLLCNNKIDDTICVYIYIYINFYLNILLTFCIFWGVNSKNYIEFSRSFQEAPKSSPNLTAKETDIHKQRTLT